MKIFSPPENRKSKEGATVDTSKKVSKGKKRPAPLKSEISESEIRDKLAAHVETSNTAKSQILQKNSKALGAGFMNEDAKPVKIEAEVGKAGEEVKSDPVKDAHLLMSDVKLNDPNDPDTQEKLKSVLRKGAFSFNPREKETLEKILGGN